MGYNVGVATVLTRSEARNGVPIIDRRGNEVHGAEGLVSSYEIHIPYARLCHANLSGKDRLQHGRNCKIRTDMALVECFAGAFAEAKYTKRSVETCFMTGGMRDCDEAEIVASYWYETAKKKNEAYLRAEQITAAFVRSPKGWQAIRSVAASLMERGNLDGDDIDLACSDAFSTSFAFDRWSKARNWPPTNEQIRSGWMPTEQH